MARKTRELTKLSKNSPYLHYDFIIDGKRYCKSTGTADKRLAEQIARHAWQEARDEAAERRKAGNRRDMIWRQALDAYLASKGDYKSRAQDLQDLRWLTPEIGERTYLSAIDHRFLAEIVAKRAAMHRRDNPSLAKVNGATVNRTVTVIVRKILTYARIECSVFLPSEPKYKELMKPLKPRHAEMMISQEIRLRNTRRKDLWEAAEFVLETGLRKTPALILWEQVHRAEGVIHVYGKGDKFQEIPITPEVERLLDRAEGKHPTSVWTWQSRKTWVQPKTGLRFEKGKHYPLTPGGFIAGWRAMCRKAGVTNLTVHDIRKTTGARMVRETGDLVATSRALNHASTHLTAKHYTYVTGDDIRRRLMETTAKSKERMRRALEDIARREAGKDSGGEHHET